MQGKKIHNNIKDQIFDLTLGKTPFNKFWLLWDLRAKVNKRLKITLHNPRKLEIFLSILYFSDKR